MSSTPASSRPLEGTWWWMANTSGSTRTRPTTSACWATRRSPFPSSGTSSKIPGYAIRASMPNFHGLSAFVVMSTWRRASSSRRSAASAPRPSGSAKCSASTTTRLSTRPLTCNTSPGRKGRGSASTGATTAAWWPVRCRAREAIAPTGRTGPTAIVDVSGLTPDQQFASRTLLRQRACHAHHADQPQRPVPGVAVRVDAAQAFRRPARRTTTTTRRASRRAICSTSPWATTTCSTATRYKWSARLTVVNLTNKEALYNFLSTFSGTHYVTPRAITATVGFHF